MIDIKYYVQDNVDVAHKYMTMSCNKNQFPELPFCGPHSKLRGARVTSKNYHFRFDTKLGNGVYAFRHIPCASVVCTSMLDKHCILIIPSNKPERYKPVTKCNYWTVLGPFNNW